MPRQSARATRRQQRASGESERRGPDRCQPVLRCSIGEYSRLTFAVDEIGRESPAHAPMASLPMIATATKVDCEPPSKDESSNLIHLAQVSGDAICSGVASFSNFSNRPSTRFAARSALPAPSHKAGNGLTAPHEKGVFVLAAALLRQAGGKFQLAYCTVLARRSAACESNPRWPSIKIRFANGG